MPSSIFDLYVSDGARAFFPEHYTDPAARRRAVERAVRPLAPEVAEALDAQNARLGPSPARQAHLRALREGAAAVVTGQQVGLFLGPLYTLYKAASAIVTARALSAESGQTVVPIFWLQTEDHDLPEIATCHVRCANCETLALSLPASAEDRISIADQTLPAEVATCLDALRTELGDLPHAPEHLARLVQHYRSGVGWATAFAGVIAELFANDGLVVIDPRDAALARAASTVHRRALSEAGAHHALLAARVAELERVGFAAPVHVRPGSPLCFFHERGPEAARSRLIPDADGFRPLDGERSYTKRELLDVLDQEPLRFSTSALLRPIVQDALLPTAAYVGGPGEIAYFAQLAPLYAAYGMTMPLILPRARFRIIEEKTAKWLARLRIDANAAARSEDQLLASAPSISNPGPTPAALEDALNLAFEDSLAKATAGLDELGLPLAGDLEKTRASVKKSIAALSRRYEKLRLHRDQARVDDVRRVKALLYPHGQPQERIYGFAYFAARYGERPFIEKLLASIECFTSAQKDLQL